jgi:photosystem II stability/assembly factor-like uncharacterized protein
MKHLLNKNSLPENFKSALLNKLSTLLFYLCLFIFIVALAFPHNPAGNWYQQFLPNLNNRPISDITFIDSLNGFAITGDGTVGDTNYILKTTNRGDNWSIVFTVYRDLSRVVFINQTTGFVCGGYNASCSYMIKTTNGGLNWFNVNVPCILYISDMAVLNEDTIWIVDDNSIDGGVYRTTDSGASWQNQFSGGNQNPSKVYFFNGSLGFIAKNTTTAYVRRTSDGGASWSVNVNGEGFRDMYFADANTGWRSWGNNMYKTTNGGLNWILQVLPYGGIIVTTGAEEFTNINRDTIWGVGGWVQYPNFQSRGLLYRTTNGGDIWKFQVPDTTINIFRYLNTKFVNRLNGWAYGGPTGIHTTNGGDTAFYLGIQQISSNIPKDFTLKQNYPNPFNPRTVIPFSIKKSANVKLIAYDITGREVQKMVDSKLTAGEYEVDFMGKFTSSGVYLYRMEIIDEKSNQLFTETKKMILLK